MATKKAAPKKAVKSAPPVKKETAKSAPKAAAKSAPVKNNKPAPKPAPKKAAAPAKAAPKKAAPAPVQSKGSKAAPVKASAPEKKSASKAVPATKKAEVKTEPVKKPVVAAPSQQEVKPAIKPLEKPVAKKEAAKPAKPVVIPKTSTTKSVKYEPDFMKSVLDKKRQQESGPTQRYSDSELTEFRDLINRKLDTAKKELAYLQGLITRKDESGDLDEGRYMTMEDGSMSMEREQLSQMASRQIQFIDHLEKAIMRIENKTYGICRVTGKLIDKARLRAVPHATLSMEAKQTMNK
ncbi:MAG TPA: TraR/DksA C4-type zinc finger protein [Flavisolibacter sp.]|jgi:RNA polymerase-binding transcription factor DksA